VDVVVSMGTNSTTKAGGYTYADTPKRRRAAK